MANAHDAVEHALDEVERARKRVARGRTKQVTRSDELDYLKSLAYSWFNSRQPAVLERASNTLLLPIDRAFQAVLEATARYAARSTYRDALTAAKDGLIGLRSQILASPAAGPASADSAPDFSPLASDPVMRKILDRRWLECQKCRSGGAHLAATVMMGGMLEALFVARANLMPDKGPLFRAKATPKDSRTKKPIPLSDWTLRPYIDVAHERNWISRSGKDIAAVLRDYRNYIHPEKERSHAIVLNQHDSEMFWDVTKGLTRQLLASVGTAGP